MLKQGVHPKIVQERLGHASIGITLDTYSKVMPGLQEEAAKAFDWKEKALEGNGLGKEATGKNGLQIG
jgi:integrase